MGAYITYLRMYGTNLTNPIRNLVLLALIRSAAALEEDTKLQGEKI